MTREEWKIVEHDLRDPKVRLVMEARCEEQGHEYENGITASFRFVQVCKWCDHHKFF